MKEVYVSLTEEEIRTIKAMLMRYRIRYATDIKDGYGEVESIKELSRVHST